MPFGRVSRGVGGVIGAALLSLAVAGCSSSRLPTSGTFSLSWTAATPTTSSPAAIVLLKPIPYSGTIAGIPVRGSAVNPAKLVAPLLSHGLRQIPKSFVVARWSGTFNSTSFRVAVSLQGLNVTAPEQVTYAATGTYGAQPIRATVAVGSGTGTSTVHFAGAIGTRHLHGTLTIPNAAGRTGTAHGSFTLTS